MSNYYLLFLSILVDILILVVYFNKKRAEEALTSKILISVLETELLVIF